MNIIKQYRNWFINKDEEGIYWLTLDCIDSSVNTLNREVLEELLDILNEIAHHQPRGLIICSGKSTGFILGADITQFTQLTDINETVELVREGQKIFDKLQGLPIPTVAMIEGFCLGGGLELALACRYRVALDSDKTRLGLPEIKLGIHPGWGGTIRLPRLIGAVNALDLILTGRSISASVAEKMGLVDAAVPKRHIISAAKQFIINQVHAHEPTLFQKLSNAQPFRYAIAGFLRQKLIKKVNPNHYPAPFAVVDRWLQDGVASDAAMLNEANSIGKLILSDTSKNLVRVYQLQERLKSLAKNETFNPTHIHVIGAGVMGGDIAAWCALHGLKVTLQDKEPKLIALAIKRAYALFQKKLKSKRQIEAAMDRLIPDLEGLGIGQADVIIEAIFENLEAKQALFKDVEVKAKPQAILATNTSSILLDEINRALQDPGRLVGIHFFNPVPIMHLVEIVVGHETPPAILKKAMIFVRRIERLPLPVTSSPGFLVNRILSPYLMEALKLAEEGVPLPAIDKAALDFGMPLGPIEIADTVGLDVCLAVAKNLSNYFAITIPEQLINKVEKGELGKKTGNGFYRYKNGKPLKARLSKSYTAPDDLTDRLIFSMINEAAACLREEVVENADYLDAGMIFGIGFAPFRGGLLHYAESNGMDDLRAKAEKLHQHYGERFKLDRFFEMSDPTDEVISV